MMKKEALKAGILNALHGVAPKPATPQQLHQALGETVMEAIAPDWKKSMDAHEHSRRACYFSMEFLVGRAVYNTLLVLDGEPCTCGRRGCWEAYSSATALIRQARQAAAEHPESLLAGAEEITGKTVFDAADRGDETANAVVDRFCDYLGAGVTNIVNALAPEVILIGGGISRQGERLLAPVRRYVEKNCFGGKDGAIPIIAAARLGNDAGIIGAAAL